MTMRGEMDKKIKFKAYLKLTVNMVLYILFCMVLLFSVASYFKNYWNSYNFILLVTESLIVVAFSLFIWIWFKTIYVVDGLHLKVVRGPFRTIIPILRIKKLIVNPNSAIGLITSTKPSKMIEIIFEKRSISIYPKDMNLFISKIKEINKSVVIEQYN